MGKRQLLTLLFVLGITLPIQLQAQVKDKGFFVEGSFAYADEEQFYGGKHYENYFIIKPAVGYQFNDKWSAGVKISFSTSDDFRFNWFSSTPFVRYNFCSLGKANLFTEGKISGYLFPAQLSVLHMVYLPTCLNIFTWIFVKTFQIQQV